MIVPVSSEGSSPERLDSSSGSEVITSITSVAASPLSATSLSNSTVAAPRWRSRASDDPKNPVPPSVTISSPSTRSTSISPDSRAALAVSRSSNTTISMTTFGSTPGSTAAFPICSAAWTISTLPSPIEPTVCSSVSRPMKVGTTMIPMTSNSVMRLVARYAFDFPRSRISRRAISHMVPSEVIALPHGTGR
jgi:hypothetical protein